MGEASCEAGSDRRRARAERGLLPLPCLAGLAAFLKLPLLMPLAPLVVVLALLAGPGRAQGESRNIEAALAHARDDGRAVLLTFRAVWCPSCRRFLERTLPDPAVQKALEGFHVVAIEIDRDPSLARAFAVTATPQIVVLDPKGHERARLTGTLPPEGFFAFLEAVRIDLEAVEASEESLRVVSADDLYPLVWSPDGFRSLSTCFSHVGYGPLDLVSQSPFQALRLGLLPRSPSTLAKGQFELGVTETWANVWAEKGNDFRVDFETLLTTVSLAYGVTDTVQVELELQNRNRFGGGLDSFIQEFHDLFGIEQAGREDFGRNENAIDMVARGNDPALHLEDSGTISQDLILTVQHNVTCGTETWPAMSYAVTARNNVGGRNRLDGSSDWDLGLSASVSRRFGSELYTYFNLGHVWFGSDEFAGVELDGAQISALLALEWRYAPSSSWILQYLLSEGAAEDRRPFDRSSHEVVAGWKSEVRRGTVLEIGLIENVITHDNSPDFGLHVGLKYRF